MSRASTMCLRVRQWETYTKWLYWEAREAVEEATDVLGYVVGADVRRPDKVVPLALQRSAVLFRSPGRNANRSEGQQPRCLEKNVGEG